MWNVALFLDKYMFFLSETTIQIQGFKDKLTEMFLINKNLL